MVGTRRPGKGQNMEINAQRKLVENVVKYNKNFTNVWKSCLNETGCMLNEKMMPDVTVMVPDLDMAK
jgi:hypothetical protein